MKGPPVADTNSPDDLADFLRAVAKETGRERLREFLANLAACVYDLDDPDPPAEAADMRQECARVAGPTRARELLTRALTPTADSPSV